MKAVLIILVLGATRLFGQSGQDSLYVPSDYDIFKPRPHQKEVVGFIQENLGKKVGDGSSYDLLAYMIDKINGKDSSKLTQQESEYLDMLPGDLITLSKSDSIYFYLIVVESDCGDGIFVASQDIYSKKKEDNNLRILSYYDIINDPKYKELVRTYYMVQ